jgi:hypothetical protein
LNTHDEILTMMAEDGYAVAGVVETATFTGVTQMPIRVFLPFNLFFGFRLPLSSA